MTLIPAGTSDQLAAFNRVLAELHRRKEVQIYEESLLEFIEYVWPVVEPATPFVRGWAIEAICEHLTAVTDGEIKRLLMNVPPGFTKPAWDDSVVVTKRGRIALSDVVVGDQILTHTGRFQNVSGVHVQGVIPVVRVDTWGGRKVWTAPDHPFLTTRGWIKASDLEVNDTVATPIPIEDYGVSLPLEEARFLGYLVGDGCTKYSCASFTNADEDVLLDFERCAVSLGLCTRRTRKPNNRATTVCLSANRSGRLQQLIAHHGLAGKDSYSKRIPLAIVNGDRAAAANFLGAYFSCDGYAAIRHAGKKTSYLAKLSTVGFGLAQDAQALGARLGINFRLRTRTAKLVSKRQNSGLYVSYDLQAVNQNEVAKIAKLPGLCERKRAAISRACPQSFDERLLPDRVVSVSPDGEAACRCLTVDVDHSFTANDIVVHNSLITDVFWPAWEWGPQNMPHLRYVCASYASHLTLRDNMRSRNVICSDRYQHYWGDRFRVSNEQFTKVKFANDKTGWKFATSVSGVTGGERGDRFIIDDPNDPQNTESDPIRATTNHWFLEVVPDRLNSITESAIIIIQQRVHEDDVSGMAISKELGYTHLMIPMEYDPGRYPDGYTGTSIGWRDPRVSDGELAWPDRFPPEAVEILKLTKGPYAYSGQYQQSPEPRGGGIFKRDWWVAWDPPARENGKRYFPEFDFVVASLDTAYTAKEENDPSALTIWGVYPDKETKNPQVMLIDAWRKRLELHGPEVKRLPGETDFSYRLRSQERWGLIEWVADSCKLHKADRLLVEAKAAGHSVAQEIQRLYGLAQWGVQLIEPKGDKVARAYQVQHLFSAGLIHAATKDGGWTDKAMIVIDEAASFPKAAHDDLVDSMTQALRFLRDNGMLSRKEEIEEEHAEAKRFRPRSQALYPT